MRLFYAKQEPSLRLQPHCGGSLVGKLLATIAENKYANINALVCDLTATTMQKLSSVNDELI